ncbi:MAG: ComEC family competence protein [bacterium]|jgi:ComEC/Rec2-related protein
MFHFLWRRVLVVIALAFASGVVFGKLTADGFFPGNDAASGAGARAGLLPLLLNPVFLSALVAGLALVSGIGAIRARRPIAVAFVLAAFFALGAVRIWNERASALGAPLAEIVQAIDGVESFTGTVVGFPRLGGEYARLLVAVDGVGRDRYERPIGRMALFWKAGETRDVTWGDRVWFRAAARVAEAPKNPGEFDYREYIIGRGAAVTGFAMGEDWVRAGGKRGPLASAHLAARERLFSVLTEGRASPEKELLVSIIYGDKTTELDPRLEEDFRRAGLTHILVVSGTQVSLIVFFLIGLLSPREDRLGARGAMSRIFAGAVAFAVVFAYCIMTGFETSVVRAFVMGALFLFARMAMRDSDGLSELARAALVVLAVQPGQLFGASFQLSFAACFGLIYVYGLFGPGFVRRLRGAGRYFSVTLLTTAGAQVFVVPILASSFNQFSAWGLLSNLVAIPVAALVLALGVVYNIVGLLGMALVSDAFSAVLSAGLSILIAAARFFGGLPGSDLCVASPPWFGVVLYYAALLLAGEIYRTIRWLRADLPEPPDALSRARRQIAIARPMLIAAVAGMVLVAAFAHPKRPRIVLLSLARGEAFWVEDARGRAAAAIFPQGTDANKRNAARALKEAMRHYGMARPAALFVAADPGSAESEAAKELASLRPSLRFDVYGEGGPDYSWSGHGAALGFLPPPSSGKLGAAASVAAGGREALVFFGSPPASAQKAMMESGRAPDAIIGAPASLERALRLLSESPNSNVVHSPILISTGREKISGAIQIEMAIALEPGDEGFLAAGFDGGRWISLPKKSWEFADRRS